jgi:putative chitinase
MLNFIKNIFTPKAIVAVKPLPVEAPKPLPIEAPKAIVPIKPPQVLNIPFLTPEILKQVLQNNPNYLEWFNLLQKFLPLYEVNTPFRVAAFLANTAHETGNYILLSENLNYSKDRLLKLFKKYFNEGNVDKYANKKILIGSRVYANRMGNGDEESQDGYIYRGKGLIQITGKDNTTALSKSINKSLSETCKYLLTKEGALVGSLFYWKTNNINRLADLNDIAKVRKAVNGGTIGLDDTTLRYNKALKLLKG